MKRFYRGIIVFHIVFYSLLYFLFAYQAKKGDDIIVIRIVLVTVFASSLIVTAIIPYFKLRKDEQIKTK